ncbi:hypothetical protein [Microbacterium sp. W4I20]|uniref:hypothetical protein n=1 Tax=Microbacterium sp. W4I20 TaxID=3042262 RepID=UPI0027808DAB|nr:hypothetical protein [Microbacterium sp. W4I20]MDQ0727233.1 hypothetical protein [Microbacterium sp. W4I20]
MSTTLTSQRAAVGAGFAGVVVVGRIRRVLLLSAFAALVYSGMLTGNRGACVDGADTGGDSYCVTLTLGPSPLVYVAIALIVLLALGRVMKATDERAALRTLDRAALIVIVLVVAASVISWVWFGMIPIDEFLRGRASVFSPFPFGLINVADSLPVS